MKEFKFDIFIYLITGLLVVGFSGVVLVCMGILGLLTWGMYQAVGWWVIAVWLGILVIPTLIGWLISRGDDK